MNKGMLVIGIVVVGAVGFWAYNQTTQQKNVGFTDFSQELQLEFFAGGSITGNSFEVLVEDSHITFKETDPADPDRPNNIDRELSPAEKATLLEALLTNDIINLPSQDFDSEQPGQDIGRYHVELTMADLTNTIDCSISPPEGVQPETKKCQSRLAALRDTLNEILGVEIY